MNLASSKKILWAMVMFLALVSIEGCSQWLAMWDDAVDAAFICSRDPSSPGCTPFGWGYKPGMGM